MDLERKKKIRESALTVLELTKGFTTKPTDTAMITLLEFTDYILELTNDIHLEEEKGKPAPVLVGTLNKRFGYNGYKFAEIGTEVYEFEDRYFFMIEPEKEGLKAEQKRFYKDTLQPCINFI